MISNWAHHVKVCESIQHAPNKEQLLLLPFFDHAVEREEVEHSPVSQLSTFTYDTVHNLPSDTSISLDSFFFNRLLYNIQCTRLCSQKWCCLFLAIPCTEISTMCSFQLNPYCKNAYC